MRKRLWCFEIAAAAALMLYADTLSRLVPADDAAPGAGWAVVGALVLSLVVTAIAVRWDRTFRTASTSSDLARAYRTRFFARLAFVCSAPLIGFNLTFTFSLVWPYYVTLPGAVIGLLLIAPTDRTIAADQARLDAAGATVDLRAALS